MACFLFQDYNLTREMKIMDYSKHMLYEQTSMGKGYCRNICPVKEVEGSRKWVDLRLQREVGFIWSGRNNIAIEDEERCSKPFSMDHDNT